MTYPLVKFVDRPDPAAAVRFDCNRAGEEGVAERKVMSEGFTLGTPTLQGDPDAVGVSYGFRQPFFTMRVKGTKAEALAALSSLSRELLRARNWLLVQVDAFTAPRWLKLYRSDFGALSLAEVWVDTRNGNPVLMPDTWEIAVPLVADAFGYGARETHDPVTVTQSPDGAHPMAFTLPAIKGDAPALLRIAISPESGTTAWYQPEYLLGCLAGETTMTDPIIDIGTGDGHTAYNSTGSGTPDAAYFGGSYRALSIGAATPNLLRRLAGTLPTVSPGRYKVLLRVEADGSTGPGNYKSYSFAFRVRSSVADPLYDSPAYGSAATITVQPPPVFLTARIFRGWVDLGEFHLPAGTPELPEGSGVTAANPVSSFDLAIGTPDGAAGTVRLDALKLIPVVGGGVESASMLKSVIEHHPLQGSVVGTFDGDSESYWAVDGGDRIESYARSQGGFPVADPAASQNLFTMMILSDGDQTAASSSASISALGTEAEVVVSYHPRYLHLGDGT